ncbi:hypothetical protein PMAYCL1PPCAC_24215, partial [Pristionchus mayeri]
TMSDAQYAPLTAALVRTLTDKLYEKRKTAALNIETQVKELYAANQLSQLDKLIGVLRELALAPNGQTRKGGLIGLAAAAIALGKNAGPYTRFLIEPVLTCFNDPDLQVRYYACESLYNIIKICKVHSLEMFDQLFDVLWKLAADTDQNVRSGAELLDRLLMDIVVSKEDFDVANLMSLIRDRLYVQTSSNRRFVVSWLNTMLTTPRFTLLPYLSEVMDGLFRMLGDQQAGVRDVTETVLGQFLLGVEKAPETIETADLSQMLNVLVVHSHEDEAPMARKIALVWLDDLTRLLGAKLLFHLAPLLTAALPSIDNDSLKAREMNSKLLDLVKDTTELDVDKVVEVLLKHIGHSKRETRVAVLNWIQHLYTTHPEKLFAHMERIFPILLQTLSDSSDEVLLLDLHLLSDVCQHKQNALSIDALELDEESKKQLDGVVSPFLVKFSLSLLQMMRDDRSLLHDRGVIIIRQLCLLLSPSLIYRALCVLIAKEKSLAFARQIVSLLNGVLLTATELFVLRDQLRRLDDEESRSLFGCLYRSWCIRPISLLGLCLLSQNYAHAAELVNHFSQVDITVDILVEIDKLVNLLESPILSFVRMDLLSAHHQRPLCTVLSALLMLLPQSEAFTTLHRRLQTVPALTVMGSEVSPVKDRVDFVPLKAIFLQALKRQHEEIRREHKQLLLDSLKI